MSREQIEEMTVDIGEIQEAGWRFVDNSEYTTDVFNFELATHLISKGYRKQIVGEWKKDEESKFEHRYHCSVCNFYIIGAPTKHCEECGAKMKGGAE